MTLIRGEVLMAHGRQPRRRFAPAEKMAMVEESFEPGMSSSAVARKYGISPSQIFQWRKLMRDGEIKALNSEENVVPESELKALKNRIKELERALGKKTLEVDTLKELIEVAREKKLLSSSQPFKKDGLK
jgi:transposase